MKTLEELQQEADKEIQGILGDSSNSSEATPDTSEENPGTPKEETTIEVSCDGLTREELVTNYMFGLELKMGRECR